MAARAKYPQSDGRAVAKRKRAVDKFRGPLVFVCERVLKRLIKAGFAASFVVISNGDLPSMVRFVNELGATDLFLETLRLLVEVIQRQSPVPLVLDGDVLAFGLPAELWLHFAGVGWVRWHKGLVRGEVKPSRAEVRLAGVQPEDWVPY